MRKGSKCFFLPPYSPEYSPDEYLNGDQKREFLPGFRQEVETISKRKLAPL
jgi:transposase